MFARNIRQAGLDGQRRQQWQNHSGGLAKLAGVSVSTVSRALNDHPLISTRTEAAHLGPRRATMITPSASRCRTRPLVPKARSPIITPNTRGRPLPLSHPFFLEAPCEHRRSGACAALRFHRQPHRTGDVFGLGDRDHDQPRQRRHLPRPRPNASGLQRPRRHRGALRRLGRPASQPALSLDRLRQSLGGRRATSHLARLGRKSIVFLGGHDPEALQRRRGYHEALKEAGLTSDPRLVAQVEFELDAADAGDQPDAPQWPGVDAIFATSDLMALGRDPSPSPRRKGRCRKTSPSSAMTTCY